jgi:hypothetical protein
MPAAIPNPIAGPLFKLAAQTTVRGDPGNRKVLALLSAYADAGEHSPPVKELARRLKMTVPEVDTRLDILSRQRLIWVVWSPYHRHGEQTRDELKGSRNRYVLLFAGELLPRSARRRIAKSELAA